MNQVYLDTARLLTQVAPPQARLFDPFLIVVVYCGLAFGESYGMFGGTLAGWIQDVYFAAARGELQAYRHWLTPVYGGAREPSVTR